MSVIVDDIFNKINSHKGVEGVILCDPEGVPIKSTYSEEEKTYYYATNASAFIKKCRNILKDLIEGEEVTFIRIRTKLNEIIISPEKDFILIAVQNQGSNN